MKVRARTSTCLTLVILLVSSFIIPWQSAIADEVDRCRIAVSANQVVSLGFPVASERLHLKAKPKVLVVPFRLSDTPNFQFTPDLRSQFIDAGKEIERLSGGKSRIDFIFSEVMPIKDTISDMVALRDSQGNAYRSDESKSTFGFVRRLIKEFDPSIDYRQIDAIYLQGSSTLGASAIAEAMMFGSNPNDSWSRPIETGEGSIFNVVLTDAPKDTWTITHELLHLYGLTDLYGSQTAPGSLSIMAGGNDSLLLHEKWILGWLADTKVGCLDLSSGANYPEDRFRITLPRSSNEFLHVIKFPESGTALMIEVIQRNIGSFRYEVLAFYTLDNEARPPVSLHSSRFSASGDAEVIATQGDVNLTLISTLLEAKDYSLLVSDVTDREVILDLIRKESLSKYAEVITAAQSAKKRRLAAESAGSSTQASDAKGESAGELKEKVTLKARRTITCTKGKVSRTVTKSNPKCPSGFVRKK